MCNVNIPLFLDIYGYKVEIRSHHAVVLEGLADDFAFFRRETIEAGKILEFVDEDPRYNDLPPLMATVYTPRNVSYRDGEVTYHDYSGRALAVHDSEAGRLRVYTRNGDLAYEIGYLFLLSQCGEWFDARGLHRVHALAISIGDCAGLVLLPMGGGKSTLGAYLLRLPDIEFLSDDSPLIDHAGGVHAFPLRLGLLPGSPEAVPDDQMRRIERMEFGPKMLVNYRYFMHRVRPRARGRVLFLGRRTLASGCTVTRASFRSALLAMMSNCVVGLGLFQGMEFVFQRSVWEIASKALVGLRRLAAAYRLIRGSEIFHLNLGRDGAENARVVRETIVRVARVRTPPK